MQGSKHKTAKRNQNQAQKVLRRLFNEALRDPDEPMTRIQLEAARTIMQTLKGFTTRLEGKVSIESVIDLRED